MSIPKSVGCRPSPRRLASRGDSFFPFWLSQKGCLFRHSNAPSADMYLLIKAGASRVAVAGSFCRDDTGSAKSAGGALRQVRLTVADNRLLTPAECPPGAANAAVWRCRTSLRTNMAQRINPAVESGSGRCSLLAPRPILGTPSLAGGRCGRSRAARADVRRRAMELDCQWPMRL